MKGDWDFQKPGITSQKRRLVGAGLAGKQKVRRSN